jgi:CRP-like cAMP-binding protein
MSRKKFAQLLKEAKVLTFSENGCAYFQGQQVTERESGSGIYLVRQGEFGGYRNDGREVEVILKGGRLFDSKKDMFSAPWKLWGGRDWPASSAS